MLNSYPSILVLIQILFRNYMIVKKVMMLALLGLSTLNCSDAGVKARVEAFLARPTYQADFKDLPEDQKRQLAQDLNEVYDSLVGVSVKKSQLKALCAPFLVKDSKAPVRVTTGQMKKAYEDGLSASSPPRTQEVAPGRVSVSGGSDVPPVGERAPVGRLSLEAWHQRHLP